MALQTQFWEIKQNHYDTVLVGADQQLIPRTATDDRIIPAVLSKGLQRTTIHRTSS